MTDSDEVPRTALEWVEQPAIVEGHVAYVYRNSGGAAAVFAVEMVNIVPTEGPNNAQTYRLDSLLPGQEQRTHAPVGGELHDGPVTVTIRIQASSTVEQLDAEIQTEMGAVAISGVLYPEGTEASTLAPELGLKVTYLVVEATEVVVGYSITGTASATVLSGFVSLDHGGDSRWMGAAQLDGKDRDEMTRIGVPLDMVDGDGWSLRVAFAATNADNTAVASTTVIQELQAIDGAAEANGAWFVVDE